jgi:tetratricopeptide (TPR) repeat protein
MPAWLACAAFESPLIVPLSRWAAMMDRALQQVLEAAFKSHQAGQLDEAERHYRELLSRDPVNPDALHLLGLLHHQRGQSGEAEDLVAKAIKHRPDAVYYENLAAIQKARGAPARAVETCRAGLARTASPSLAATLLETLLDVGEYGQALALLDELERSEPTTAGRLADRAFCLVRLGRRQEAASAAERSLSIDAANGNALAVLAEIVTGSGNHAQAVDLWRRALAGRPDWTAARINLGLSLVRLGDAPSALDLLQRISVPDDVDLATKLLNGLSAAYRATERLDRARHCLEAGVALAPASAEVLNNLSEVRRSNDAAHARRLAERAIAVDPEASGAHNNLGLALEELDHMLAAIASIRRAVALKPAEVEFLNNLAGPCRWLARFEEAEIIYLRVVAINAIAPVGWCSLGAAQLAQGKLAEGWINYDWRTRKGGTVKPRPFDVPQWEGPARSSGTLLVWGEQGLGDELIFGSMLSDLARVGIPAVVECDARMVGIFSRSMPSLEFRARTTPPDPRLLSGDVTAQVPMGGFGRWFRRRMSDFPDDAAFLTPRPDLLAHWRMRLAELGPGPKIGFGWRSRRMDGVGRRDHPPVLDWAPVLTRSGATFVSLQYGEVMPDIQSIEANLGVKVHSFADLDLLNDLEGALALSAAVDMTISSPTTVFCLPAAAGSPVWLVAPASTFMLLGTGRFPFFPSVRVFVHEFGSPRSEIIGQVGRELEAWLAERQRAS